MRPAAFTASALAVVLFLLTGLRARAEDDELETLVARVRAEVERTRGVEFVRPVEVRYVDPFRMMMGAGPRPGGPGDPSCESQSPEEMLLVMGRTLVAGAALGVIPEEEAAKWIGPGGRLRMPDFATLFGDGPPGMPPMGGMPAGPGEGMPEGILGAFYRDDVGEVNVLKTGGAPVADLLARILAHELTHALDDQRHDISRFTPTGAYRGDRLLATQAVVEGSAVFSELDYVARRESDGRLAGVLEDAELPRYGGYLNEDGTPARREHKGLVRMEGEGKGPGMPFPGLKEPPKLFGKHAIFPYAYGFEFVKHLRKEGVAVDRAYDSPPLSTEQILHPAKYLDAGWDEPTVVKIGALTGLLAQHDVEVLDERVLGEFMTRCVLEEHGTENAEEAAAGWDGDVVVSTSRDGHIGLLWASVWDTEEDAAAFEDAARAILAERFPTDGIVLRGGAKVLVAGGLGAGAHEALSTRTVEQTVETRAWEEER